ncbi:manganese peroxidase 1 [Mycena epipterygia]|nr:manganese peroxidase 1 [Mycena epipterygia]
MKFSSLLTVSLVYITTVSATPSIGNVFCSNGHQAPSNTCCVWYDVLKDIQDLFQGICGDDAHDALRLAFHDAIGFSPALTRQGQFGGGGADGSIIAFGEVELEDPSNEGLESIVASEKVIADTHGVSYGDMIQFAAAVSVRNCPGGPRIPFLAGRAAAVAAAPEGLVPNPFDSATTIINRVGDAGLTPNDMVDLLASHSIAVQEHIDETIPNRPFDTTPGVFDTNFFLETLLPGKVWPGTHDNKGEVLAPFVEEFRLQSDFALARDSRTSCRWQSFIGQQSLMMQRFGTAMQKMALLGHNANSLVDCSVVVPAPTLPIPGVPILPFGLPVHDLELTCPAAATGGTSFLDGLLGLLGKLF